MYEESVSTMVLTIIPGIISLVLFIILFVNILQISKNVKSIKKKMYDGDAIELAIILISENKSTEAIDVIRKAFLKDCINELSKNWYEKDKCDEDVKHLEHFYSRHFKTNFPIINKDYLHDEYLKVRKFYIED